MDSNAAIYPSPETRDRAVLVQNISHAATGAAIDDFFSFCGTIESKKIRTMPPKSSGANPTLEAVVIFTDEGARRTALMMNDSIIVDQPVAISAVPATYDFNAAVEDTSAGQGGLFGGFGGFFAGVSSTLSTEYKKAAQMLDQATETGVLKAAKDQVVAVQQKTMEIANEIDDRYHVKNTILNAAENGKQQATFVANTVATQTRNVATTVDESLHISEKTTMLADKAMENETVKTGYRTITDGFQSLMNQAGLQNNPAPASNAAGAQQTDQSSAAPVS